MRVKLLIILLFLSRLAFAGEVWVDGQTNDGHIIQVNGTTLTQEPILNFIGGVSGTDSSGKTVVNITTTGGGYTNFVTDETADISWGYNFTTTGNSTAGYFLGNGSQLTGLPAGYSNEEAQDAVGAMIVNTSTINLTYIDATPELKADLNSTLKTNYDTAYGWGNHASAGYITNNTALLGDVTGTANATVVGDDSHAHTTTTISGLSLFDDVTSFPADPNADRFLAWDDDPGAFVFLAGGGGEATTVSDTATLNLTLTVADITGDVILLKDLVTTAPLTGGTNDILVGADSDITIAMPAANTTIDGYLTTNDWNTFNDKMAGTLLKDLVTSTPLAGGTNDILPGADSDVTLSIADAAADATTKGASTYNASDFNAASGLISLDYANGQISNTSQHGFLSDTDWGTFNGKMAGTLLGDIVATAPVLINATTNVDNIIPGADTDFTISLNQLGDVVATTPLLVNATTNVDNILPGADTDFTFSITVLKDLVTTSPLTGGTNDIFTGTDSDITVALDKTLINNSTWGSGTVFNWTFDAGATDPEFGFATNSTSLNVPLNITSVGNSYFSGNLGVGGTNTTTPLYVTGANNAVAATVFINANQAGITASDTFMDFRSTTGSEATIAGTAVAGVVAYNTFLGSHWTEIEGDIPQVGMVLEMTGNVTDKGNGGISYLAKSRICKTPGSNKVYGVYGGQDKEGHHLVFGLGAGVVLATGEIKVGDLLEADGEGYARKQWECNITFSTLGKAVQSHTGKKPSMIGVILYAG